MDCLDTLRVSLNLTAFALFNYIRSNQLTIFPSLYHIPEHVQVKVLHHCSALVRCCTVSSPTLPTGEIGTGDSTATNNECWGCEGWQPSQPPHDCHLLHYIAWSCPHSRPAPCPRYVTSLSRCLYRLTYLMWVWRCFTFLIVALAPQADTVYLFNASVRKTYCEFELLIF